MAIGAPVLILKEGTQRVHGREAMRNNIFAARVLAEVLKSSLGPRGLDKMLVDSFGDVTITNDGATILKEMEIQHPAAKLLVEVAKAQDAEVGDGTTSAVVLAGTLLDRAENLLDQNIHPTTIMDGYKKALDYALQELEKIAVKINVEDRNMLKRVAATSLHSKYVGSGPTMDKLTEIAVDAVLRIAERKGDGTYEVKIDNIKIEKKKGGSLLDTRLVEGIVLDKEVVHPGMPRRVENAYIVLLDAPLEVEKPEITAKINITSPEQIKAFLEEEAKLLKEIVDRIYDVAVKRMEVDGVKEAGIVVITQKGIDEVAQHFLAKKKILAVRRVKRSDMEKLEYATGGKIVSSVRDLKPEDLGYAKLVEERKVGNDKMVFIEGCPNPKAVTILVRGANDMILDEAERSLNDALHVLRNVLRKPMIVAGGGAPEVELAMKLRKYAESLGGKEQLAVEAFADAMEEIPMILAESAGLDALQALMDLRKYHADGKIHSGIDVLGGKVHENLVELDIIDPLLVKEQVLKSATEAAITILKIDDVIAAAPKLETKKGRGGVPEE